MAQKTYHNFFQIHGLENKSYEGISLGINNYGYENVWFSLEVSLELMKDLNQDWQHSPTEECIVYDNKEDVFLYTHNLLDEGDVIKFKPQKINNKKVYGIGSSTWCWHTEESMKLLRKESQQTEIVPDRVLNKAPHLKLVISR